MDHKLSLGLAMLPLVPAVQAQEQGRTETRNRKQAS